MEGGGFAAARPSIVKKEIGGALAWNRGHLPFNDPRCTITCSYSSMMVLRPIDATKVERAIQKAKLEITSLWQNVITLVASKQVKFTCLSLICLHTTISPLTTTSQTPMLVLNLITLPKISEIWHYCMYTVHTLCKISKCERTQCKSVVYFERLILNFVRSLEECSVILNITL